MSQLFIVLLMEILAGAEVDLFVPSFPELQHVFSLTPFKVELTLGVNLIAYCISSLIVGNLGDRYGRKPVIIGGLLIFISGTLLCLGATEYWHLLGGRFLQGIGISAPAVLAYLIIADAYPLDKQQQLMGALNGAVTLGMAFAPVLGSYVTLGFHWQGNFGLLLILALSCLAGCAVFIPKGISKPHIRTSLKEYLPIFHSKKAFFYIMTISFWILPYWVFIAVSPILYMENLGVDLKHFGFYQGSIAIVFSLGSFSSGYFLKRFGQKRCFYFGLGMVAISIGFMALIMVLGTKDPLIITFLMLCSSAGVIFPINILWPCSLESVPEAKGRIAALIMSARLILTSAGIQTVSYFYEGTFLPLGIAMCLSYLISFWFGYKLFQVEDIFSMVSSKSQKNPA